jgi:uncharacterized protein YkwD
VPPDAYRPRYTAPRARRIAAAVLAALAFVAVAGRSPDAFAASCGPVHAAPAKIGRAAVERAVRCELNAVRRGHGLRPVRANALLAGVARDHSRDMVQRKYFAHTSLSGTSFVQRIRRSGYLASAPHWMIGETLAWGSGGFASVHEIVQAWMHSPPHRRVILHAGYREVGVGVVWGAPRDVHSPAATYTADFAAKP